MQLIFFSEQILNLPTTPVFATCENRESSETGIKLLSLIIIEEQLTTSCVLDLLHLSGKSNSTIGLTQVTATPSTSHVEQATNENVSNNLPTTTTDVAFVPEEIGTFAT